MCFRDREAYTRPPSPNALSKLFLNDFLAQQVSQILRSLKYVQMTN